MDRSLRDDHSPDRTILGRVTSCVTEAWRGGLVLVGRYFFVRRTLLRSSTSGRPALYRDPLDQAPSAPGSDNNPMRRSFCLPAWRNNGYQPGYKLRRILERLTLA